jgi:HAE1 family hydrophobic/amphiphilic exporter-1
MFVNFFIRRPVFAIVCSLLIILAGAVAIPSLPVAEFPQIARRRSRLAHRTPAPTHKR